VDVYAIIKSGGRQVRVEPGAVATVDRLEAEAGQEVTFEQVLLVEKDGGQVLSGSPYLPSARVLAVVERESRGPKIRVFRKKRRKSFRRTTGHRSTLTRVLVKDIIA
jgi:large subunit ribosomal protein L21